MKPNCPLLTVDNIILYQHKIVLVKRKNEPYKDMFALPGGFVDTGETVENAVKRESKEETGLNIELFDFIGIYSEPSRDPRGHVITLCYTSYGYGTLKAGSDAKEIILVEIDKIPKLAFDHNKIIEDAKEYHII